jgi:uncharacterized coiled-coil protein SlyX
MQDGHAGRWVGLAAAGRALGIAPETLRKRIRRGRCDLPHRMGNDGRWWLLVPDTPDGRPDGPTPPPLTVGANGPDTPDTAALARLDERVSQQDRTIARLETDVADLRAERDRLLALVEQLAAERREPERRPWPGVRRWWRRFVEGESG